MISVSSKNNKLIKPSKFIDKLVDRSLSNSKNDVKTKVNSRNENIKAVFHNTQESMFETSPIKEISHSRRDNSDIEVNNQYIR